MARSSGGAGSRFASSNLNDLYGKPAIASSASKSRYGSSASSSGAHPQSSGGGGGMLVLARGPGSRGAPHKGFKPPQPKLTVPAPVNLPSLRKEHAGNDPGINLVSASATPGATGWSKQQQQAAPQLDPQLEPGSHRISPGWASAAVPNPQQGEPHPGLNPRSGKYTPPGARGGISNGGNSGVNPSSNPPHHHHQHHHPPQASSPMVVLRGEDFPTLQASAPFNPVPPQKLQREKLKKDEGYNKSLESLERAPSPTPPLALQPQRSRDEGGRGFNSLKENRKPSDYSLRPGPLLHLNHTSNWAEDEREVAGLASQKGPPEWEDGPRYYGNQRDHPRFHQRDVGYRREHSNPNSFNRRDVEFERDAGAHSWRGGEERTGWRERENYPYGSSNASSGFFHEGFGSPYRKTGTFGGGRNGGVELPVRASRSSTAAAAAYSEDVFFPELPSLDVRYKMRRRRNEAADAGYRDLERESFETELERVQKEQEVERQRRNEERERAMEAARREQEERERAAREEEERQRRAEEEAREAAARAEMEAYESVRKAEEGRRFREEERRRMAEEEEMRKQNARRKLLELEERMALRGRGVADTHSHHPPPPPPPAAPPVMKFEEDDELGPMRFPSPRMHQDTRLRPGDAPRREPRDRDRDERWLPNGDSLRSSIHSPRTSVESGFMEDERRWGRRSRPFSPPSPTSASAGFGYDDGVPYGRLRQSLPKQPRVPPPPVMTSSRAPVQRSSSVFSRAEDLKIVMEPPKKVPEPVASYGGVEEGERLSTPDSGGGGSSCVVDEEKLVEEPRVKLAEEESSGDEDELGELQEVKEEEEPAVSEASESSVEELVVTSVSVAETPAEVVVAAALTPPEQESPVAAIAAELHGESLGENEEKLDDDAAAGITVELQELVEPPVVIQAEEHTQVEVMIVPPPVQEQPEAEEKLQESSSEVVQPSLEIPPAVVAGDSSRPLLPSPFAQPPIQQGFHQPPAFMPFDPRPRLQGPHSDRPMTLQFGLLPGTSLLQGSIPAIQIGSIQMPLQLHHPPIGHPVAHHHLQPPPQFQFGQIGQQAPLLPFTVHPQAMLQPSMMGMDGRDFRMQPHQAHQAHHHDRTFWASNSASGSGSASGHFGNPRRSAEKGRDEVQSSGENEKSREVSSFEEAPGQAQVHQGSSSAPAEPGEEDDFIEVRSKRQLLNDRREQKEKVKSKPKYMKAKEQAAKQKHASKSQMGSSKETGKKESSTLRNVSLDAVVTTARTRQVSLSNPEVGFEKRTKSPQPQINSLVSDAPAFPPIVAEGQGASQANGPVAWGFNRANQEAMGLSHTQLEEAMKPARFEVPVQQQDHLPGTLEAPSAGPSAAPGPINSLLAGEKIQFGAVTMPAFVSPVPWLGPSRPEGFRKETPEEAELMGKGKRLRESDDGASGMDSEAEAEAAASAVAVAAITNDDFVHGPDQLSHGVIGTGSNKASPAGQTSEMDEAINVSLPADLSVDMPLRGTPHSNQLLPSIPGSFPGMEMGTLLGGPVFAFGTTGDTPDHTGAPPPEQQQRPGTHQWQPQPHHDSFYGGPHHHSYAGPFINHHHHGPIPSIPPHTLVYTSPFGGVGQFGQLGMSYMSPAHMAGPVKQPDWKHTPTSSTGGGGDIGLGGGIHYGQHNNRHMGHDPSVVPVVPPGPFDVYRDMSFQSQWSGPHPMPGFPMHLRHPHPAFHLHQHHQQQMPGEMNLNDSATAPPGAPPPPADFPDELLGDSLSTTSDANSSFVLQQQAQQAPPPAKPASPSLPAGSKLRSRVIPPGENNNNNNNTSSSSGNNSRPQSSGNSGGSNSSSGFQPHSSYVSSVTGGGAAAGARRQQQDKKNLSTHQHLGGKVVAAPATGWGNSNNHSTSRKTGPGRSQVGVGGGVGVSSSEKSTGGSNNNTGAPAGKLKQVYVAKPVVAAAAANANNESCSEMFTADARHM